MALKPCLDCGTLSDGPRCPVHRKARDNARYRRRGTRHQRGLNSEYIRNRSLLLTAVHVCENCGRPGTAADPLTADHIVKRADGGGNDLSNLRAVHASYNYSQGRNCRRPA